MIRQKEKRMLLTMVLIAAVFIMGVVMNTAHAGNMAKSSEHAANGCMSQGLSQMLLASALIEGSTAYLYDAYLSMSNAKTYANNAYTYACYGSGGTYAYYASMYAGEAWNYLDNAETYAYYAYYYSSAYHAYIALLYGGAGSYYCALAEFYAGIGSYGGNY